MVESPEGYLQERKGVPMVRNNRTNEEALREGRAEKARLLAEEIPQEELEEQEREERKNIHESRRESESDN